MRPAPPPAAAIAAIWHLCSPRLAPLPLTAAPQCAVPIRRYAAAASAGPSPSLLSPPPPPPPPTSPPASAHPEPRLRALTAEDREFLDRALRVNQAGELGANLIYSGQYFMFQHNARLRPLIAHMWEQEKTHLRAFDDLLRTHRVRPTALRPLWNIAGPALGLATAALGEKAAMACTEAVETEIGSHYNDQIRQLLSIIEKYPELNSAASAAAAAPGEHHVEGEEKAQGEREEAEGELHRLVRLIRKFRDEELEHLDTAVEHDSKDTEGYEVLTAVIRGGCKAAIWLSSRI